MNQNDESAQQEIYQFLKDTSHVFNLVKKYSILVEEILPEQKAPVHPANELKSLVFHLYNSAVLPDNVSINILEAKEHLFRAFYDLHNIIISAYIEKLKEMIKRYKRTTVANAFPEYANTIRPTIRDIQEVLREIRTNRNTDIALLDTDISTLTEQVKTMARFDDIVESMQQEMNLYESEEHRKNIRNKVWDITKIIIAALIGAAITYFGISNSSVKNSNNAMHEIQKDSTKKR